jgi:hypothetical protein
MGYTENLLSRIRNSDDWPAFERPDFLDELNAVADNAFSKDSIEGYLASMLIYHQVSEEMLRLLISDTQFFIQLAVFPAELNFPTQSKMTYGDVIKYLTDAISFKNKEELIYKAQELNRIRIELVHKLTSQTGLADIKNFVVVAKAIHDEMFRLFEEAHDYFRVCFHDFYKDTFIDYEE